MADGWMIIILSGPCYGFCADLRYLIRGEFGDGRGDREGCCLV